MKIIAIGTVTAAKLRKPLSARSSHKRRENDTVKKVLKVTGKILLGLLILIAVFLIVMVIVDRSKLKKEAKLLETYQTNFVETDGHRLNVHIEGEGTHTLVFLPGFGTSSPVFDFKRLYDKLKDDYKIVIVEKFGYGFSDTVESERSFDTILRQDREALKKAGVEAPYILCPHSMSGLEALLWAQKFPDEVEAFIGLDPALPDDYTEFDAKADYRSMMFLHILVKLGVGRLFPVELDDYSDILSNEEMEIFRALIYKNMMNICLVNEGVGIHDACAEISGMPKPEMPMLLFYGDGTQTGGQSWIDTKLNFAKGCDNIETVSLDCRHDVQNYKPDEINSRMREFLAALD